MEQAKEQADAQMENELVNKIVANAEIDLPKAMISRQADQMINTMAQRMRMQGITLQDFMKYTGQTIDTMRQQYAPEAERRVRTELTLKAIAAAENVTPTDDEISDKIDEFAEAGASDSRGVQGEADRGRYGVYRRHRKAPEDRRHAQEGSQVHRQARRRA